MARRMINNNTTNDTSLPTVIKNSKGETLGSYDEEMITTLKNTVAKDASNSEFQMFMSLALTYDLDPFKKEIYFGKSEKSDKVSISFTREGYRKIAQKDENYNYYISDYVCANDTFKMRRNNDKINLTHEYSFDRGDLKGAYCILYTKSGEQLSFYADFSIYNQSSTSLAWKNYPADMILKTAEIRVFKSFTDANGGVPETDADTVLSENIVSDIEDENEIENSNEIKTRIIQEE